jgi:hypothetical protein
MTARSRIVLAVAIVFVVAAGWFSLRPLSAHGDVILGGTFATDAECGGTGRLATVRGGSAIYVAATDVDGPVANGFLRAGVVSTEHTCRLSFEVGGIPRGFREYTLLVTDTNSDIVGATRRLSESDLGVSQTMFVEATQ